MHLSMSNPRWGGRVGNRVGVLTFSKKNNIEILTLLKKVHCISSKWFTSQSSVDFLKSPSSCLFSSRRTKDFSYLVASKKSSP